MKMQPINLGTRPKGLVRPQDLVPGAQAAKWWKISNATDDEARIDIYDMIDSWGGAPGEDSFWGGISAEGFQRALSQISASKLAVHVNSPGGDVFDGITIMNALIQHPATVTAYVDGLAASIASVICMGADEVVMGLGAQMMIHDASGVCFGQPADMQKAYDLLNSVSDNIAGVYAYRAGGTAADWRATMQGERWYTADEAVTAKLAQRAVAAEKPDEQPTDDARRWVTAAWRYAGRDAAPDPISSQTCTDAGDCTTAPPREDLSASAGTPVQLPDPVFDGPQLVRALREAVKA